MLLFAEMFFFIIVIIVIIISPVGFKGNLFHYVFSSFLFFLDGLNQMGVGRRVVPSQPVP